MPKGSLELTEKRKNEILDACERIYRTQGFYEVSIKEISTETSMTRSAIYNYFKTKEEILLGLLIREYDDWCQRLEEISITANRQKHSELAQNIAHTLEDKETLLRILNMNLFEIEQNSRVERLADFKVQFKRSVTAFCMILCSYKSDVSKSDCEEFCEMFSAFLFGVFPFTTHTKKQLEAMQMAGVSMKEPSIYEMVERGLLRMIPEK
ncbi:TetR/AcrR family transcriptional regulator [Campylobacter hyointestinalis]|uniref:TetR/AcrR family transcriptional regulator n=1 Tax=Campylobacter hyointestinalis TaxID=198 RepID=UPI000CE2CA34|nr:TetR family transcriptional regulator [Campylobacter hyointestinalis]PPB72245.1 TetR family transcriptional regulator [Campylobacter hyointestinalis subsp. hyointestinalis]PPB73995.1 TetR family transcriptional regulator [Campylobacter hyointestinalis subsp. hyointestinalis]PPB76657.1 TetR family transcriptional regulator [Campylobacter hyointestinalis subsp. hyointestinalis]PPB78380.1 TetR family transcriptional regulator [Campylobacter hyointestinalis subsp. hyointestinalis]